MTNPFLTLPLAILAGAPIDEMGDSLRKARERLADLESQLTVLRLSEIFEQFPALLSFSFKRRPGSLFYRAGVKVNDHALFHYERPWVNESEELQRISEALDSWLSGEICASNELVASWEDQRVARPPNPENLLDSLMSQCLDSKQYAAWQAGCLETGAAAGVDARRPKSL